MVRQVRAEIWVKLFTGWFLVKLLAKPCRGAIKTGILCAVKTGIMDRWHGSLLFDRQWGRQNRPA
jgi:hypothetical protein